MKLAQTNLSISTLLRLMEGQVPESIQLNHVVINDHMVDMPSAASQEHLPAFTVQFSGFVDVEFFMDTSHQRVVRLCVRQSAMTFAELDENGDVLPSITIDCRVLTPNERKALDKRANSYIKSAKMHDKTRGEALLTQYVAKAMFCPKKYGNMSHA